MPIQDGRWVMTTEQQAEMDRVYAESQAAWKDIYAIEEANPFIRAEKDDPLYSRLKAAEQREKDAQKAISAFWGAINAERSGRPYVPEPEGSDSCSCETPEPSAQYECGECGEVFNECDEGTNRCPSCGKFASRTDIEVCAVCGEEIADEVAA